MIINKNSILLLSLDSYMLILNHHWLNGRILKKTHDYLAVQMHEILCFFDLFIVFSLNLFKKIFDVYLPFSVKLENILMESVFSGFENLWLLRWLQSALFFVHLSENLRRFLGIFANAISFEELSSFKMEKSIRIFKKIKNI